jgi:hypothetical protein
MSDYAAPDPYAQPLEKMRDELRAAEEADPFARAWAERAASELVTTRKALDAESAPRLKTASEAELEPYVAPDPYATDLAKMRSAR